MKVREIIKKLERDGWVQVRRKGSHRLVRRYFFYLMEESLATSATRTCFECSWAA